MIMIDFVKITSELFVLDFLKILFTVVVFLFMMGGVSAYSKTKEKNIVIFIFSLMMIATFFWNSIYWYSSICRYERDIKKSRNNKSQKFKKKS